MNFMSGHLVDEDGLYFHGDVGKLALSAEDGKHLQPHAGKEVFLGIRPEDIHSAKYGSELEFACNIDCEVDVIEPMGNELFLYVKSADNQLVARVDPRQEARVGQSLPLRVDMAKVHFFDVKTEENLV